MKTMELRVAITVSVPEGEEAAVGEILRRYFDDRKENMEKTIRSASNNASIKECRVVYKDHGVLAPFTLQQAGWV